MRTRWPRDNSSVADVAIIGGGINGLAIARDAAMRGANVVLLERQDIGGETSAWSSRLIHGGLKYLERYEWKLVAESAMERRRLLRNAPHLVRPYPMLVPFYRDMSRSGQVIRAGMYVHDLLAIGDGAPKSRRFRRSEISRHWPTLNEESLLGAALFTDAQVPWAERLCVELGLSAARHGARILTRAEVTDFVHEGDAVTGVLARDPSGRGALTIRARAVVNAAGPWVDEMLEGRVPSPKLIGGTKGSHLVVDPFPGAPKTCIFFEASADRRPMFIMPWVGRYLIGTTDIAFDGDLSAVRASDVELSYLLTEINRIIPSARLSVGDVLFSYAGVRPLGYAPGARDHGEISRGHTIVDHGPEHAGLFSVTGGKLTTHRALAQDVVDAVATRIGLGRRSCPTRSARLPGAESPDLGAFKKAFVRGSGLRPAVAARLVELYGVRAVRVKDIAERNQDLLQIIDEETHAIAAEVVLAVEDEGARDVSDVLFRRTMIGLNGEVGLSAAPLVSDVLQRACGWTDERVAASLDRFHGDRERYRPRTPARRESRVRRPVADATSRSD